MMMLKALGIKRYPNVFHGATTFYALFFLQILRMSDNGSKNRKVPFSRTAAADWRVVASKHKLTATTNFPKFEWFVYMAAMFEHGNASWNLGVSLEDERRIGPPFSVVGAYHKLFLSFLLQKIVINLAFILGPLF